MTGADELGGKLLEGVSRSFYLTLKALPQGLREPLSLAYLLARAADTLADTERIPEALKTECLREFDRLLQSEARDASGEAALCARLRRDFMPLQTDKNEAHLLERLHEALEALRKFPLHQFANIRSVLAPIVRGQMLDIERFPADGQLRALNKTADLDEYTWLVAGCVGKFWTKLCAEDLKDEFSSDVTTAQMIEWGTRFGKGLQLVNILRDIGKDLALGRCYFPSEELEAHGINVASVHREPSLLRPLLPKWQNLCREHLACGVDYIEAVQHKRLRFATSLPLLLGIRTLNQIESATWPERIAGVKISRADVGKVMFEAGIAVLRRGGIRRLAEKMH